MTRDDTIRMARKSRIDVYGLGVDYAKFDAALERFADLVAAAEREACAKVVETHAPTTTPTWVSYAAAIRARGQA